MTLNAFWNYWKNKALFTICWFCLSISLFGQNTDSSAVLEDSLLIEEAEAVEPMTVQEQKAHSPKKAAFLAGFVPGGGQIYNRKYWKLPIVYGGFGGLAYAVGVNAKRYKCYNQALFAQADGDSTTVGSCNGYMDVSSLRTLKNRYKSNMDLSIIGLSVWWVLTVIDAVVDAHLFEFDVGDDLSLRIEPQITPSISTKARTFTGVRFVLRL
jgi:hypothetical protein